MKRGLKALSLGFTATGKGHRSSLAGFAPLAVILLFAGHQGALAQCPPNPTIFEGPGLDNWTCGTSTCTGDITWTPVSGYPGLRYTVWLATLNGDGYCGTEGTAQDMGTTTGSRLTLSNLQRERVFSVLVHSTDCTGVYSRYRVFFNTFSTRPSVVSLAANVSGTSVTLSFTPPDTRTFGHVLLRSTDQSNWTVVKDFSWAAVSGQGQTAPYCPAGQQKSHVDQPGTGIFYYRVATYGAGTGSDGIGYSNTVTVNTGGCTAPSVPAFSSVPELVTAGSSFTVSWTATLGADTGGRYEIDVANNTAFTNAQTTSTQNPWLTISTEKGRDAVYYVRVRAVSSGGCKSANSSTGMTTVQAPPAVFAVVGTAPIMTVDKNATPPATVEVVIRNIGSAAGNLSLSSDGTLFSPSPASFSNVSPGQDVRVRINFGSLVTGSAGLKTGNLIGSWVANGQTRSLSTPVSLTVLEGSSTDSKGSRLQFAGTNEFYFRHTGEGNPPSQQVTIVNTGSKPVRLASQIGPGGSWLSVTGDFANVLQPGARRTFTLAINRAKRTADDGRPPLVTGLVIVNVDGNPEDSAYGQVIDEEPADPVPGSGRTLLTTSQYSLIVGSVVSATGANDTKFLSDGWIRNQGATEVSAELFCTPNGVDGLTGSSVLKNTVKLGPYTTYRLANLVNGLFKADEVSGQIEIRSSQLSQLSVRTTADAITTKENVIARYGAEIPIVVSGQGVRKPTTPARKTAKGVLASGDAFAVLLGLRDPEAGFRSNLIFAETTGKQARVTAKLYNKDGVLVGQKSVDVGPYSKSQVNYNDTSLFPPGVRFDGGTVEVYPESGNGAVAVFATVIDNKSSSYSTRGGEIFRTSDVGAVISKADWKAAGEAAFLPAAVRSIAANNSYYTTRLAIANLGRTAQQMTLTYIADKRYGGGTVVKQVPVPARAEGPKAVVYGDVLFDLFNISEDSAGMIKFEGNLAPISIGSETTTPIDPLDPGKGRSLSAVNPAPGKPEEQEYGVWTKSASEVVGTAASGASQSIVTHPAIEEGFAFRTNLIMAELAGETAQVRVRIAKSGSAGAALGEKTYSLDKNERLQINRVVRDVLAVDSSSAEFKDIEIQIEAVGGNGRVLSLVTKIDNNPASKRADIFTLGGAIAGSPIGFGN